MIDFKKFRKSEDGGLSIEAVLSVPMIVWCILATFVFWDGFKTINSTQKATYTIADLMSREPTAIDSNYLASMHEMFDFLSSSAGDNRLRVSVVWMSEDPDTGIKTLNLDWSHGVGGFDCLKDLDDIRDRLPDMAGGDSLIVVEGIQEWSPSFGVGLGDYRFRQFGIARSRVQPRLTWDGVPSCSGTA